MGSTVRKFDRWGCHNVILLVEVVGFMYPGVAIEKKWSTCGLLVVLGDAWLHHLFSEYYKDNQG